MQCARKDRERRCFPNKAVICQVPYGLCMKSQLDCSENTRVRECWFTFQACVLNSKCSKGRTAQRYLPVSDFILLQSPYIYETHSKFSEISPQHKNGFPVDVCDFYDHLKTMTNEKGQ